MSLSCLLSSQSLINLVAKLTKSGARISVKSNSNGTHLLSEAISLVPSLLYHMLYQLDRAFLFLKKGGKGHKSQWNYNDRLRNFFRGVRYSRSSWRNKKAFPKPESYKSFWKRKKLYFKLRLYRITFYESVKAPIQR